eukprot:6140169-Amphidinium_carterae.1
MAYGGPASDPPIRVRQRRLEAGTLQWPLEEGACMAQHGIPLLPTDVVESPSGTFVSLLIAWAGYRSRMVGAAESSASL